MGLVIAMHPTTTEHDFRFPKRTEFSLAHCPGDDADAHGSGVQTSLQELHQDLNMTYSKASNGLMGSAIFPFLSTAAAGSDIEEAGRDDPLATQVWRFFHHSKRLLPNQDRMENLTWRMMNMQLQKTKKDQERNR